MRRAASRAAAAALPLLALLLLAAGPGGAAAAKGKGKKGGAGAAPPIQVKVDHVDPEALPKSSNPYAGKPYAGCEGGYCPSGAPDVEAAFWRAADAGDVKGLKKLLSHDGLNLTRNIVPDSEGFARVVDVAVWAASFKGHTDVMKVLLGLPGVKKLYEYEDGHILDLAAANGHEAMVKLLLEEGMPVGAAAMAHAAHYNHTNIMGLLLSKPTDIKAAMQAIAGGGSPQMASIIVQAMRMAEATREKRHNEHDWQGEYVRLAISGGNVEVLKLLLADENYTIPWQAVQGLVMSAAEGGNKAVFELLFAQKVLRDDPEELDEAVGNGLKVAAEMGQEAIVDWLLARHKKLAKAHCKAAVFRALKYGHSDIADTLTELCPVDKSNPKLADAEWLGQVAIAARDGDAAKLEELLARSDAAKLLRKLQTWEKDPKTGEKTVPRPPHPTQDPIVLAARGGHLAAVTVLAERGGGVLCVPCAAGAAAKGGHGTVVRYIAEGPGKAMLHPGGPSIDHALRVVAHSMEGGHWDTVGWMVKHHGSQELGPYFLNAIAQENNLKDLEAMLGILKAEGIDKTVFFKTQVESAKITAGLGGHVELLLKLEEHSDPLTPEEVEAEERARAPRGSRGGEEEGDFLGEVQQKLELRTASTSSAAAHDSRPGAAMAPTIVGPGFDTLLDPTATWSLDKVSCMRGAYFAHVTFCYLVFLSGIAAFVSRVVPAARPLHAWFGRGYIVSMLWATATSLLIHNTGLPPSTLVSFIWVLGGLCVGWLLALLHGQRATRAALAAVGADVSAGGLPPGGPGLAQRVAAEKARAAGAKTAAQRFFSLKAAHGIIMFVSWINVAGRIFASNQSGDFTCHTIPVFKPLDTPDTPPGGDPATLVVVPPHDPNYARQPWARLGTAGWGATMLLGPAAGAAAVGLAYSVLAARRSARGAGGARTAPSGGAAAVAVAAAGAAK
ncbi:hypothetical protein HT031_002375 [Scenedesmus sp. PABB004]|nr:hypothetical protein HT031_002375 [Scenedesmus sp. PABB004]